MPFPVAVATTSVADIVAGRERMNFESFDLGVGIEGRD
jgi:hypothetical protein